MTNKWIALNLLLLITALGLTREYYQQHERFKTKNDPAKIEPVSMETQAAAKTASGDSINNLIIMPNNNDADYFVIAKKTLFSDTRRNEKKPPAVAPKVAPLPKPHPILVGTVMIDGQFTASVINQFAQQQARNIQLDPEIWRVGHYYRGYRVTSIEADQLVLENGGAREVLPLNRTAARTSTVRSADSAARVISIGPTGRSKGVMTMSTTTGPTPGRDARTTR